MKHKHIYTLGLTSIIFLQSSAQSANNSYALLNTSQTSRTIDKKERAREALPELLRAVFNSKWMDDGILLTVDAGWRNDSLAIEYKYYKGNNLLTLDEKQLVEKILFTINPAQIDVVETEVDEFTFLYLRNKRKSANIVKEITKQGNTRPEEQLVSSMGFPVRAENLALILQYLKDLR